MKRSRNGEQSPSCNSGRFGADTTNNGAPERGITCGTGEVSEKAPTSVTRKARRIESPPGRPGGIKQRGVRSCGRDLCGIVFPTKGGPDDRLCAACHRPSQEWTHFSADQVSRVTQCVEDLKKYGVALPTAMLEDYRPSTDCLCTKDDCIASFVRKELRSNERERTKCSVCRRIRHSGLRKISCDVIAQAISFFTTGKGASKRKSTVDCAGTWLTESSLVCSACRHWFSRYGEGSGSTSGTEETESQKGKHIAVIAKEDAKAKIQGQLRDEQVITTDDALDILATERRTKTCRGDPVYERVLAQKLLQEVGTEVGNSTRVSSMEGSGASDGDKEIALVVVPPYVSPEYAAQVIEELYRTRAELRVVKKEVNRLKNAKDDPFAGFDEAVIAESTVGLRTPDSSPSSGDDHR